MRNLILMLAILVSGMASAQITLNYGPFQGTSFSMVGGSSLTIDGVDYSPVNRDIAFQSINTADEWSFALALHQNQHANSQLATITSQETYQIVIDLGPDFDGDPSGVRIYRKEDGIVYESGVTDVNGFELHPSSFGDRFKIVQFEHGTVHGLSANDIVSVVLID